MDVFPKYRVFIKKDKKTYLVEHIDFSTKTIKILDENGFLITVKGEYVLLPSTHKVDKNGVEIFCGDRTQHEGVIEYIDTDSKTGGFKVVLDEAIEEVLTLEVAELLEVIGSAYED